VYAGRSESALSRALLSSLLALAACGERTECEACMVGCLEPKSWDAKQEGWSERTRHYATLVADHTRANALVRVARFRPYPNLEYRFIGCGDAGFADIDVVLYDADNTIIARDIQIGRDPDVLLPSDTTGLISVRMFAADLRADSGEAGVLVMAR
jgi:hypothetical protein